MSKVTSTANHPVDLSDGRTLAPGESATKVDTEHPHQRALVLDGLLRVEDGTTPRKRQPQKRVEKAADAAESDDEQKE